MPSCEAPCVELGSAPRSSSAGPSPSPSEVSSTSSPEPQNISAPPLFRILAMPPPDPEQPPGQEELERRLPGYRRIVIPRELTLIELLKQCSGATTDDEVLRIREAKLRVMAERVGLRRLHVLAPRLRSLTLDGSALTSLRDLGIGLVHLKVLSVNRCGLTSLDGVWGLSALRELYAAGNRLQDLQPLAALQKLHTLNLAENPIADSSRLWMLAVCGALRRLTLRGTPASDEPNYRSCVSSALPLLLYLDDHSLNADSEDELDNFEDQSSNSDSEVEAETPATSVLNPSAEPEPGPSSYEADAEYEVDDLKDLKLKPLKPIEIDKDHKVQRRRPASTEGAGVRPRVQLPPRPKTAHDRPEIESPARLQILNTLMDDEWRGSGSKLTSCGTVCGNLAQALRRPASSRRASERKAQKELIEEGVEVVQRTLAEEIPSLPRFEDWVKFKEETGIDIDIDFTRRPDGGDPLSAIERLERIEKETKQRLEDTGIKENFGAEDRAFFSAPISDYDLWKMENLTPIQYDVAKDVDSLFNNINITCTPEDSIPE